MQIFPPRSNVASIGRKKQLWPELLFLLLSVSEQFLKVYFSHLDCYPHVTIHSLTKPYVTSGAGTQMRLKLVPTMSKYPVIRRQIAQSDGIVFEMSD